MSLLICVESDGVVAKFSARRHREAQRRLHQKLFQSDSAVFESDG
jgi:hypothetical protein